MERRPSRGYGGWTPPRGEEQHTSAPTRWGLLGRIRDVIRDLNLPPTPPESPTKRGDMLVVVKPVDEEDSRPVCQNGDLLISPDPNSIRPAGQNGDLPISTDHKSISTDGNDNKQVVVFSPEHKLIRSEKNENQDVLFSPAQKSIRGEGVFVSRSMYAAEGSTIVTLPLPGLFGKNGQSTSFWSIANIRAQWNGYKTKYYKGKDIIESFKKDPGFFKDIGREASGLLMGDYVTKHLRGISSPLDDGLSIAVGMRFWDPEEVSKLLFKGRLANCSLIVNATNQAVEPPNTVVNKMIFHDILGPKSKGLLYIPYPYENEQFEVRTLHRFAGFTGHIRSGVPHAEFSLLLGTYLLAVGGMVNINAANQELDFSYGVTARTSDVSLGLVMSRKDHLHHSVETSVWKTFENNNSVAFCASHTFADQPWAQTSKASIGAAHFFPNAVTVKARLSSSGLASILVKKTIEGRCSLVMSSDFQLGQVLTAPKIGVLLSIP